MPFYADYPIFRFDSTSDEDEALCERREQAAREKKLEEWLGSVPALAGSPELLPLSPEEECVLSAIFDVEKWEQDHTPHQRSYTFPSKPPCLTAPAEAFTEVVQTAVKRKREESGDEDCGPRKPACPGRRVREGPQAAPRSRAHKEHRCRWRYGDGQLCTFKGVSQDAWAHVRTVHGLNGPGLIRQEPAPVPIVCGWHGCTHPSIAAEMHEHWKQEHEAEVKQVFATGGEELMECALCHKAWLSNAGTMLRHLNTVHWKDGKKFCDNCGGYFRADVFNAPSRDHRGTCLTDFMDKHPGFIRR
ncbi:hypothetical protein DAEQUDRAFT_221841 [Daedalea quercina L-15889]|uniref:Uncharacterized protein n=1 Tax=Daedalea quercina L-15889 TaxID=1314783 RepID=A0A165KH40_9APHY|nr:hypothetical protein DAEQUDRAFT_221841 [Daedalea quercina L-15889]